MICFPSLKLLMLKHNNLFTVEENDVFISFLLFYIFTNTYVLVVYLAFGCWKPVNINVL